MKLLLGTPGWGWRMYGLLGNGERWFFGFSMRREGVSGEQGKAT